MKFSRSFAIVTLAIGAAGVFAPGALTAARADEPAVPQKVSVDFLKIYVPDGYEANNIVEIVGEGMFQNACYHHTTPTVKVNEETKTIDIGPAAYKYNGYCLQVILPFNSVINLGILKAGDYLVTQNGGRDLGKLHVAPARTSAPDDYLYAPISQAFYKNEGLINRVDLSGSFPTSCMKMVEVKTHVQSDVLVLQPIATIDHTVKCEPGAFHFETTVEVGPMNSGRYLLHVRSMNGHSVNSLIDVP